MHEVVEFQFNVLNSMLKLRIHLNKMPNMYGGAIQIKVNKKIKRKLAK
jgi:hypothetical protein